jgi:hypothetical protein
MKTVRKVKKYFQQLHCMEMSVLFHAPDALTTVRIYLKSNSDGQRVGSYLHILPFTDATFVEL